MEITKEFIIEQLELQADHFESIGDKVSANKIRDLINKDINKKDDAFVDVELTVQIDKFDGERKDGDLPVETIIFKNGEIECL